MDTKRQRIITYIIAALFVVIPFIAYLMKLISERWLILGIVLALWIVLRRYAQKLDKKRKEETRKHEELVKKFREKEENHEQR